MRERTYIGTARASRAYTVAAEPQTEKELNSWVRANTAPPLLLASANGNGSTDRNGGRQSPLAYRASDIRKKGLSRSRLIRLSDDDDGRVSGAEKKKK